MALTYPSTSPPHDLGPEACLNNGKRKLPDDPQPAQPKRTKTIGPFVMEEDEDDEDADIFSAQNSIYQPTSECHSFMKPAETPLSSPGEVPEKSSAQTPEPVVIRTCSGKTIRVPQRKRNAAASYERIIASRSVTAPGRATKSYYGIDIHNLLDEAAQDSAKEPKRQTGPAIHQSIEAPVGQEDVEKRKNLMWTEKYRARKFRDLLGDERTHRSVLRWLRGWDQIVFPGFAKQKAKKIKDNDNEERHRKVLLLAGPPGLGKTTLAHVCARQAGYEVLEINASDERNRDVVKGRLRDAVGTENVKSAAVGNSGTNARKSSKPVCVVVDEVDGVVTGSGGGEGGFMKALVDLLQLDQRNSDQQSASSLTTGKRKSGKADNFRLLRPVILICNDAYHPSLRPLRTSSFAEIVHVRQVALEQVVDRMKNIFRQEGIPSDGDGVRKLCEASWGLSNRRDSQVSTRGVNQGDIRGVMVAAEWVARQLRTSGSETCARLTRKWMEQHILNESLGGGSSRGLSRGGTREIVERVFLDGAGFPYKQGSTSFNDPHSRSEEAAPSVGVADLRKRYAIERLREMVDAAGEYDRCILDCFLTYPSQDYQDDTFFSKPNKAHDWLHFHDSISSRVYSQQDWELNPYLSQPILAFHHLFSASKSTGPSRGDTANPEDEEEEHPFSGPRADFAAFEAEKQNRSILSEFRSSLTAPLLRTFRSLDAIATELVPSLTRMLAPEINPVVVGGSGDQRNVATVRKESERTLVKSAVRVMNGVGITFEKARVEMDTGNHGGFVFRMEPSLDVLTSFSKVKGTSLAATSSSVPVRYAVRQVLETEYRKEQLRHQAELRQQRLGGTQPSVPLESKTKVGRLTGPKRDFFGRIIPEKPALGSEADNNQDNAAGAKGKGKNKSKEEKVWVSYHEGFSNAVRKGIAMGELLSGL